MVGPLLLLEWALLEVGLQLFSYWRSSCSYRVRLALAYKGLDHEIIPVHLVKDGGEQHSEEYLAKNPMGQVPCLVEGDLVISQSMVILDYLETVHPEPSIFGSNLKESMAIRQIAEMINTGIQPIQNLSVLNALVNHFGLQPEAKAKWAKMWIERGLLACEEMVKRTAGDFCVGDQFSAADCFLIPQIYNAKRFKVDMRAMPTLDRIDQHVLAQDWAFAAHPDQQPDAVT